MGNIPPASPRKVSILLQNAVLRSANAGLQDSPFLLPALCSCCQRRSLGTRLVSVMRSSPVPSSCLLGLQEPPTKLCFKKNFKKKHLEHQVQGVFNPSNLCLSTETWDAIPWGSPELKSGLCPAPRPCFHSTSLKLTAKHSSD